jgi:ADP-ribosylglycohydrolase
MSVISIVAEAFHRGFFKNFSKGLSVNDCAGPETFDTSSIGALVMLPIIAFAYHYDVDMAKQRAVEHVRLTHRSTQVEQAAEVCNH